MDVTNAANDALDNMVRIYVGTPPGNREHRIAQFTKYHQGCLAVAKWPNFDEIMEQEFCTHMSSGRDVSAERQGSLLAIIGLLVRKELGTRYTEMGSLVSHIKKCASHAEKQASEGARSK